MEPDQVKELIEEIAERMASETVTTVNVAQLHKAKVYLMKIALAAAMEELAVRTGALKE